MKHEFKGNLTLHSHDQRASGTVPIFINILYASALFPMSVSQSSLEPLLHISINALPRTTSALPCECVRESVWRGSSSFYPETPLSVAADCAQLHGPWSKRPPGRGRGVERGERIAGRGGGGHCLFEGRYPLPNNLPCFSALSTPQYFFYRPLFLRGTYHRTPKSNSLNTKVFTKVIQSLLNSFLYKECHVSNKIEEIETRIIS